MATSKDWNDARRAFEEVTKAAQPTAERIQEVGRLLIEAGKAIKGKLGKK